MIKIFSGITRISCRLTRVCQLLGRPSFRIYCAISSNSHHKRLRDKRGRIGTPFVDRFTKGRKQQGVALLLVMISLALISAVVTDLGYQENIRYKLAIYQKDAAKAEALAKGGLNVARLFLVVQEKLQTYLTDLAATGVPLPGHTIWTLLPLESSLFKSLVTGDLANSIGSNIEDSLTQRAKKNRDRKEVEGFSRPVGGFGNFDGSFDIEIIDEESKISVANFAKSNDQKKRVITKNLLLALFADDQYAAVFEGRYSIERVLDQHELLGNIFGYIDAPDHIIDVSAEDKQWGRRGSGSKKSLYTKYGDVKPKGANFDSFEEIRLVHGITDAHMDILQDAVSVYGSSGKINILSANEKILRTLVRYCTGDQLDYRLKDYHFMDNLIGGWAEYKQLGFGPVSPDGFMKFLQAKGLLIDSTKCKAVLGTVSQNFTIKSNATVGQVNKTLTLVTRIVGNSEELYYFDNN